MSRTDKRCTWMLETWEDDELVASHECGQTVVLTFVGPRPGRPGRPIPWYPRCKRHSPPAAIREAYKMGLKVVTEENYEPPPGTWDLD